MASDKKIQRAVESLANVRIVLVEPKYAENIGSVARIAHNMGIRSLFVVRREIPDFEIMARTATHHAKSVLETMRVVETLAEAVADCSWVVGTTARQGRQRFYLENPKRMVANLLPKLACNKIALVFGPEHRGLTNDDLGYCNSGVTIPTAGFSSINVAQAVGMICYELFSGLMDVSADLVPSPALASSAVLKSLHAEVASLLSAIGYVRETDMDYWMHQLIHFSNRVGLRAREVKVIKGLCRQVQWLAGTRPGK
jgi:tRNA/rRNA methyltransferase